MGIVKLKIPGNVHRKRIARVDHDAECRTTRSISRTSCGTKKTNVKIPSPSKAWEKICRQMYRSISRITAGRYSSTLELMQELAPELAQRLTRELETATG